MDEDRSGGGFIFDAARYGGESLSASHALRFLWVFRRAQKSGNPVWRVMLAHMREKYGLEIPRQAQGRPLIGDEAWIGVNAAIVGGIRVGSDVLIAPGAYVNCDVPDHSIVLGNPCRAIPCENATEGYINRRA